MNLIEKLLIKLRNKLINSDNKTMKNVSLEILIGLAVGDAIGVPYEFLNRNSMDSRPATNMTGYGTHNQAPGTWSDDSSLAFCLAETLIGNYDLDNLKNRFINWYDHAYWTAHDDVFDIGIATRSAISSLRTISRPELAGGKDDLSNGNGSLMRILPLVVFLKNQPIDDRFKITKDVSSLTHAHIRSVLGCFIYLEFALQIINCKNKSEALQYLRDVIPDFCLSNQLCSEAELSKYKRILTTGNKTDDIKPIEHCDRTEINSSGYVVSTLEASIWCIMTSDSYAEAVLKAVNLGDDTDTTGCVTGGLAAIIYGYESIPNGWVDSLARLEDIKDLANRLFLKYNI